MLDAEGVGAKGPARGSAPAAEQEEQEQERLGDAGFGFDDLPRRTCVHCMFSSRYLQQCDNCHEFSCVQCFHRCGLRGRDEWRDQARSPRMEGRRSGEGWLPLKPHPLVTLPLPPSNLWIPGLSGLLMMRPSVQWSGGPTVCQSGCCLRPSNSWPSGSLVALCQRGLRRTVTSELIDDETHEASVLRWQWSLRPNWLLQHQCHACSGGAMHRRIDQER